jgi:alpha-methylacyl-CoA racemase
MGPLAGMRVIEMAGIGPGPFCAMMLADMGADVIRIDRSTPRDLGFEFPPEFDFCNRGRRSAVLDLKTEAGAAALRKLARVADALIEGFRPGVMERLGLGPDELLADNPRLVYGRVTGWGQDGPLARSAGHDINYIALTGMLDAIGPAAQPVPPLNPYRYTEAPASL